MGGANAFCTPLSIAVDGSGNSYISGYFSDTIDFDPGTGVHKLSSAYFGNSDIFILKLNATGNFVWAESIALNGSELSCLAADSVGNIYLTGSFTGTKDFDPGPGIHNLTAAAESAYILKLDAAGNFVWVKKPDAKTAAYGTSKGLAITVDAAGNIYTTGAFFDTVDFDPGAGTSYLYGNDNVFVLKLDASGNFAWAKQMGGLLQDYGFAISADVSGNVYTTGIFQGSAAFGTDNFTSAGDDDIFVCKMDASGNFVWTKQLGGSVADAAYGISTDASGNVYTTGYFNGTADFDPGSGTANLTSLGGNAAFVSKLDKNGNFVWAKSLSASLSSWGYALSIDNSGNVYTTGYFSGTLDFDPGSGVYNLSTPVSTFGDAYTSILDSSGNFVWAAKTNCSSSGTGTAIAVKDGYLYNAGYFIGTGDFDPGSAVYSLTSIGMQDGYVTKMSLPSAGVNTINGSVNVSIWPNPAEDFFTISNANYADYVLKDVSGKAMLSGKVGRDKAKVDIRWLPAGLYMVTLTDSHGIRNCYKLVKR
jgi:hypothetical protein